MRLLPHTSLAARLAASPPARLVTRCAPPQATLFGAPIEAIRGTTQALFNSFELRAAIGVILVAGLFNGASLAYRSGARARTNPDDESLKYVTLALCVAIDLISDASYVAGEAGDTVWAPLASLLLYWLYGSNSLALLEFLKEALPGSDVLPLATIAWTLANAYFDSAAARALGLDLDERDDDEFR